MRAAGTRELESTPAATPRPAGDPPSLFIDAVTTPADAPTNLSQPAGDERADRSPSGALAPLGRLASDEWRAVAGWTLGAFLLRLLTNWGVEQAISPDGVYYVNAGRSLVAGNWGEGLSTYWPPLYPLLVGLSSLVFRDAEFAGRFVSVVAGALLVVPAYRLARAWYGRRAAGLSAALVALHPLLVYYSTVLLTEATYTLLFACGVLAGWAALSGRRARAHFAAGAIFGACYLLKPEAAGFLALLLAPTLCEKLFDRRLSFKMSARNALTLCAGFLMLALPYLLYLRHETGAWTISGKLAAHRWQGGRRGAGALLALPPGTLVPDAATALVQMTKALRAEYEIFNLIFPTAFVLLAGLGLFRTRWTGERARRELYLFSFVAAAFAGYAVTLPNIRFFVPLLPLLLCWAARGVVEFEGWAVESLGGSRVARGFSPRAQKVVAPLVVAVLLATMLPLAIYLLRGDKWGDYGGQKRAAVWIAAQAGTAPPVVMSTAPVAAFYAGGRHVQLVEEDYAALVARARREGVAYVVVNERTVKRMNPLLPLLDGQAPHAGLRLAHTVADAPGHKILVYALDGAHDAGAGAR